VVELKVFSKHIEAILSGKRPLIVLCGQYAAEIRTITGIKLKSLPK
jgi:hypothetical protein